MKQLPYKDRLRIGNGKEKGSMNIEKVGDKRYDEFGEFRIIAISKCGYWFLVRRPGRAPLAMHFEAWRKLNATRL